MTGGGAWFDARHTGTIVSVNGAFAHAVGLAGAMAGELLRLPGGGLGLCARLEADRVLVELLVTPAELRIGDAVRCTGQLPNVPVGAALRGRIIDALGRPLDGRELPIGAPTRLLRAPAPALGERSDLREMLWTGVRKIDLFASIGRGERVLISGGWGLGKSTLALDAALEQRHSGVVCIVAPLADRPAQLAEITRRLEATDGLAWTLVAGGGVLAPYAAFALAEEVRASGGHALVVLDDLDAHAAAWTRRAYALTGDADVEGHRHALANLFARAAPVKGGGSITLIATLIATLDRARARLYDDARRITDAVIHLDETIAARHHWPAIDLARSARGPNRPPLRGWGKTLYLALHQHRELARLVAWRAAPTVDAGTQRALAAGERLAAMLRQPPASPIPVEELVATVLGALLCDDLALADLASFERNFIAYLRASHADLLAEIRRLNGVPRDRFAAALREFNAHQRLHGAIGDPPVQH